MIDSHYTNSKPNIPMITPSAETRKSEMTRDRGSFLHDSIGAREGLQVVPISWMPRDVPCAIERAPPRMFIEHRFSFSLFSFLLSSSVCPLWFGSFLSFFCSSCFLAKRSNLEIPFPLSCSGSYFSWWGGYVGLMSMRRLVQYRGIYTIAKTGGLGTSFKSFP